MVVKEALATLSPAHCTVLIEIYYRRSTASDAAEVLGLPTGTVKSRLFHALRALRRALEAQGVVAA